MQKICMKIDYPHHINGYNNNTLDDGNIYSAKGDMYKGILNMKRLFLPFLILTSILIFMFGLVSPALASDGDDLEVINEKCGLPIVVYQDSGRKSLF